LVAEINGGKNMRYYLKLIGYSKSEKGFKKYEVEQSGSLFWEHKSKVWFGKTNQKI
jgi:hypothetical protein